MCARNSDHIVPSFELSQQTSRKLLIQSDSSPLSTDCVELAGFSPESEVLEASLLPASSSSKSPGTEGERPMLLELVDKAAPGGTRIGEGLVEFSSSTGMCPSRSAEVEPTSWFSEDVKET